MATGTEIVIEEHLGLVHAFAKRFAGRGVEYDDLYGAGCVGLVKAAKAYDKSRNTAFSTYAVPIITGEMKRLFRDDGTVKVSRRLKEIYMKAMREKQTFEGKFLREPTLTELAQSLNIEACELSLALTAGSPVLSLTVSDDSENEAELNLPVVSFEDELISRIALKKALLTLDKADLNLVNLRFYRMLTQQKTAEILGMTQVQVSRRERKIMEQLKEALK